MAPWPVTFPALADCWCPSPVGGGLDSGAGITGRVQIFAREVVGITGRVSRSWPATVGVARGSISEDLSLARAIVGCVRSSNSEKYREHGSQVHEVGLDYG